MSKKEKRTGQTARPKAQPIIWTTENSWPKAGRTAKNCSKGERNLAVSASRLVATVEYHVMMSQKIKIRHQRTHEVERV